MHLARCDFRSVLYHANLMLGFCIGLRTECLVIQLVIQTNSIETLESIPTSALIYTFLLNRVNEWSNVDKNVYLLPFHFENRCSLSFA